MQLILYFDRSVKVKKILYLSPCRLRYLVERFFIQGQTDGYDNLVSGLDHFLQISA